MRHRVKNLKLGRKRGHLNSLIRNLATSLVLHERIKTTDKKAKAVQPVVERLISTVKRKEEREAIRSVQKLLYTKEASIKMVSDLKKRFDKKTSGFTRITQIGVRPGDGAASVQIELTQ